MRRCGGFANDRCRGDITDTRRSPAEEKEFMDRVAKAQGGRQQPPPPPPPPQQQRSGGAGGSGSNPLEPGMQLYLPFPLCIHQTFVLICVGDRQTRGFQFQH